MQCASDFDQYVINVTFYNTYAYYPFGECRHRIMYILGQWLVLRKLAKTVIF